MTKRVRGRFRVEQEISPGVWHMIPFVESGSVKYCHGWVDCADSHYPCKPLRIVKVVDSVQTLIRQTNGRGEVHLNSLKENK